MYVRNAIKLSYRYVMCSCVFGMLVFVLQKCVYAMKLLRLQGVSAWWQAKQEAHLLQSPCSKWLNQTDAWVHIPPSQVKTSDGKIDSNLFTW